MSGTNDRKVSSAFKAIEFDDDRIARRACNSDLRSCTGRATWPARSWLKAWLFIGCLAVEVDFVGGLTTKRIMWAALVVPIDDQTNLPLELRLVFRHDNQPQDVIDCSVKYFDYCDRTVTPDRAEPWQDVHRLAPILLEVLAFELTALIDNYMFWSNTFLEHDPIQCRRHFFGRRLRLENREAHRTTGEVVNHVQHPPAYGPTLPDCVGNPIGPEAAADGHGSQIGVPGVRRIFRPRYDFAFPYPQRPTPAPWLAFPSKYVRRSSRRDASPLEQESLRV